MYLLSGNMNLLCYCIFIVLFGNMLFPIQTAECFSLEYHNSRKNIIILFLKYLADIIRSEAWLNLFWEYINGKLFAMREFLYPFQYVIHVPQNLHSHPLEWEIQQMSFPFLSSFLFDWITVDVRIYYSFDVG